MKPSIVCAAMVKNEEKTISRMLFSASKICDRLVVLDTGSTDSTLEILRSDSVKSLFPRGVEIFESPFKGFGPSRTELSEKAANVADWILFLDADDTIEVTGDLDLDYGVTAYRVRHGKVVEYWLPRLCRGDRVWQVVGRCHEYLKGTEGAGRLENLRVHHHNDGFDRPGKLQRNLDLLLEDYAEDAYNPRTVFYLAQTYRDIGDKERACGFFKRRIDMKSWDEEVFYSQMEAARLGGTAGDLLMAWGERPWRAEPLYHAATKMAEDGFVRQAQALEVARAAIPTPKDILFVDHEKYGPPRNF